MTAFREALAAGRLVFDGPMGTQLLGAGHRAPLEELNATAPQAVREVHRAYAVAGARALRANTLLAREGEVQDARGLGARGLALAREAAPPGAWVGASVGAPRRDAAAVPTREQPPPGGGFRAAVARQAAELAGADFLALEAFLQPAELDDALAAAAGAFPGPVLAFFTLRSDLPTRLDAASTQRVYGALEAFLEVVTTHAVAGVAVSCVPPGAVLELARDFLARRSDRPWGLLPSAPDAAGGAWRARRNVAVDHASVVEAGAAALDAGASFVGACCGCTPETIRRLAAVAAAPPGTRRPGDPRLAFGRQARAGRGAGPAREGRASSPGPGRPPRPAPHRGGRPQGPPAGRAEPRPDRPFGPRGRGRAGRPGPGGPAGGHARGRAPHGPGPHDHGRPPERGRDDRRPQRQRPAGGGATEGTSRGRGGGGSRFGGGRGGGPGGAARDGGQGGRGGRGRHDRADTRSDREGHGRPGGHERSGGHGGAERRGRPAGRGRPGGHGRPRTGRPPGPGGPQEGRGGPDAPGGWRGGGDRGAGPSGGGVPPGPHPGAGGGPPRGPRDGGGPPRGPRRGRGGRRGGGGRRPPGDPGDEGGPPAAPSGGGPPA
ncbi:MAG: homocysteine S-methyltransferase family protein [Gemmatimonadota bacterium]